MTYRSAFPVSLHSACRGRNRFTRPDKDLSDLHSVLYSSRCPAGCFSSPTCVRATSSYLTIPFIENGLGAWDIHPPSYGQPDCNLSRGARAFPALANVRAAFNIRLLIALLIAPHLFNNLTHHCEYSLTFPRVFSLRCPCVGTMALWSHRYGTMVHLSMAPGSAISWHLETEVEGELCGWVTRCSQVDGPWRTRRVPTGWRHPTC